MGVLGEIVVAVLALSVIVFTALFGRIPAFRYVSRVPQTWNLKAVETELPLERLPSAFCIV